jgi:hypothetical protein
MVSGENNTTAIPRSSGASRCHQLPNTARNKNKKAHENMGLNVFFASYYQPETNG